MKTQQIFYALTVLGVLVAAAPAHAVRDNPRDPSDRRSNEANTHPSSSGGRVEGEVGFRILPDYHLTPEWVKAGAYFRNNGVRVKASQVNIHVMLPVSFNGNDFNYKTRDHNENNVGEPDWSGWWDEPWRMGFFYYTVSATYNGEVYQQVFVV